MKRHLTEEQLIQHKFKLASDEQTAGAAEHLAGCAECGQRLEQLNQKFAALDLLAEDIPASEELISQVIARAKRPVRRKIIPFGKYHWIGAAAAVLVLGLTLLIGNLGEQEAGRRESAEESKLDVGGRSALVSEVEEEPEVRLVAKALDDESGAAIEEALVSRQKTMKSAAAPSATNAGTPADNLGASAIAAQVPVLEQAVESFTAGLGDLRKSGTELAGTAGRTLTLGEISDEPPFAPASAIELVTLPRRDNVQLTIYNSADLTLVREKRNLTLKQGWNWLQLMWANTLIDPTSLSLEPAAQADKIDVQQLVFPARLRELGRWLIRSEISGQVPFEITYFTSGLTWRAFYMGTLSRDEKKMRLQGYVRVANNSGEDYENAQTRLLVGKVNVLDKIADLAKRQYAYERPGMGVYRDPNASQWGMQVTDWARQTADLNVLYDGEGEFGGLRRKEIRKEGLSEYFLYTIEGTETIADKWGKRLPSFDVEDIDVESLYKYDEERWGAQTIRFVSFANDDEHNLGETPIPDGSVKIYGNAGDQGYLSYVGGTNIKYIPVNEEIELNLGPARLVKVEPKLMAFKTDNYVLDNKGNIAGWDEIRNWQMEVTNTRMLPIEIEITRGFGTAYWTLVMVDVASRAEDAISYEKHDATHARFTLKRRPSSKWTFGYTVTTYHGRRQEQANQ